MAEPTLQEVFGAGATQDADVLTVSKTDLDVGSFIAALANRAETLFLAMFLKAKAKLNETNRDADKDIQIVISDPDESLTTESGVRYKVVSYTVELYVVSPQQPVNVMDF